MLADVAENGKEKSYKQDQYLSIYISGIILWEMLKLCFIPYIHSRNSQGKLVSKAALVTVLY